MLLAAPVNWLAIPRHGVPAALPQAITETAAAQPLGAAMLILAFFFAATWFVQGAHPIGAAFLVALGAPGIIAFALLHGAGNGMITIAKGTLPLALRMPLPSPRTRSRHRATAARPPRERNRSRLAPWVPRSARSQSSAA